MNKANIITSVEKISLRGCVAYSLMCLEKYIMCIFPDKSWRVLVEHLWDFTNGAIPIDVWDEKTCELLPECIFENNYYDSRFSIITEKEYDFFVNLYSDIDENISCILEYICDMEENFAYTVVNDKKNILPQKISYILDILIENKIDIPDIALLEFSKRDENNGLGNCFDGSKFSIIL